MLIYRWIDPRKQISGRYLNQNAHIFYEENEFQNAAGFYLFPKKKVSAESRTWYSWVGYWKVFVAYLGVHLPDSDNQYSTMDMIALVNNLHACCTVPFSVVEG